MDFQRILDSLEARISPLALAIAGIGVLVSMEGIHRALRAQAVYTVSAGASSPVFEG